MYTHFPYDICSKIKDWTKLTFNDENEKKQSIWLIENKV